MNSEELLRRIVNGEHISVDDLLNDKIYNVPTKNQSYTKPPLGLTPHYVWVAERVNEIISAMNRYIEANKEIPNEWLDEYNKLIKEVK